MLDLTTRDQYQTLLDAEVLVGQDAAATAIIYVETGHDPITISRGAFRERAGRYAAALTDKGIAPRDLVIIAHTQNLESIYAFWGAMLIGAIPSMFSTLTEKLDPDVYTRNMAELVTLSDVRAIVTTDDFAPTLRRTVHCAVYGSSEMQAQGDGVPASAHPDATALLQHSSGTTGLQKGVALSHRAVLNQLASYSQSLNMNAEDVIVSWLPLYHDMGLIAGFLLPLVQGRPLVLMSPFDWVAHPAMLLRAIHEYDGTLCWLPNFAYNHMARRTRKRDVADLSLENLRAFINCSEPVRHDSHQLFLERFAATGIRASQLSVSYAMAENTFAVTQTRIGEYPELDIIDNQILASEKRAQPANENTSTPITVVSCGEPIPNTRVQVVDDAGAVLPERHVGELVVQSDCMLTEYYQRPDLEPFVNGWYRTGDMGYLADGEVYVVGRKKDLIINAGKNVYPQDIEAVVNTIEGVHPGRVVVFGVPDEREGTERIAVVAEVDTDDADTRKAIQSTIRQRVVQQTTVSVNFVHLVEKQWLLKTSSGKIARAANREKWLSETNNPQT